MGETNQTVALRMPLNPIAIELLNAVGPMAVSSANKTGQPAATNVDEAIAQLGEAVTIYLDGDKPQEMLLQQLWMFHLVK